MPTVLSKMQNVFHHYRFIVWFVPIMMESDNYTKRDVHSVVGKGRASRIFFADKMKHFTGPNIQ